MLKPCRFLCLLLLLVQPLLTFGQKKSAGNVMSPRMRVIIDNDFSGDPDGLFQLAHLLLSPLVEVRAIIGSHLKVGDGFDNSKTQANNAAGKARELINLMKLKGNIPVLAGSNTAMPNDSTPVKSAAMDFITKEALSMDTDLPLYLLSGAGLTEIASAVLTNPAIANKMTLVWIGGPEYSNLVIKKLILEVHVVTSSTEQKEPHQPLRHQ